MNILLVDSSVQHLNKLVKALRPWIFPKKIMVAMTVSEAYEALAAQKYDLVVTDINLPDESGMNLLNRIKTDYPACVAIIYTNADNETLEFLKERTGLECFEKPTGFHEMVNCIVDIITKK